MGDLYLKDSKGRYHQVCFQAFGMSCGPASVAMVERLYKHLNQSDEQRALDLSVQYPGGFTMEGGTYSRNLSSILNAEGVKAYQSQNVGSGSVYSYLKYYSCFNTPVIAHVKWAGSGAHFVVCAIADDDDTFVFYDPWYGIVEVAGWQFPTYSVSDGSGEFSGFLVITYR
jgi:predicted double-glycine peptidase